MISEEERLAVLESYRILDTESEEEFDDIVENIAIILDVPICLISLVDSDRQWFKAKTGLAADQTDRSVAFCHHAIQKDEIFVVEDTLLDERFHQNPLVLGDPNIRFYAGAPLITEDNAALGTICIISDEPRQLSTSEESILLRMSARITRMLKARKEKLELEERLRLTTHENQKLVGRIDAIRRGLSLSLWTLHGETIHISNQLQEMLQLPSNELALDVFESSFKKGSANDLDGLLKKLVNEGETFDQIFGTRDNRWFRIQGHKDKNETFGFCIDITKFRDEFHFNEAIVHLLESSAVGAAVFDSSGTIEYTNSFIGHLTGESQVSLQGKKWQEVMRFVRYPQGQRELDHMLVEFKNIPEKTEIKLLLGGMNDHTLRSCSLTLSPVFDDDGKHIRTIAIVEDLSQYEEKVMELENLRSALVSADIGVILTDKTGNVEWCNDFYLKLSGLNMSDAIGSRPIKAIKHLDTAENQMLHKKLINYQKEPKSFIADIVVEDAHKEIRYLRINNIPILDDDDELANQLEVITDLTAVQLTEDENKRLMHLLEIVNSGVIVLDSEAKVKYLNIAAHHYLDSDLDVVGKPIEEIVNFETKKFNPFAELDGTVSFECEVSVSGEKKFLRIDKTSVLNHMGEIQDIICVITDISQIRYKNDEIQALNESLLLKIEEVNFLNDLLSYSVASKDNEWEYVNQLITRIVKFLREHSGIDCNIDIIEAEENTKTSFFIGETLFQLVYCEGSTSFLSPELMDSITLILRTKLYAIRDEMRFANEVVLAEKKERERLSRELHDGLSQELASISMGLKVYQFQSQDTDEVLGELVQKLDRSIENTRRLSHNLIPSEIEEYGIANALKVLVTDSSRLSTINYSLKTNLETRSIGAYDLIVYRCVQELINNVNRHSKAMNCKVLVERREGRIFIEVSDDGIGIQESIDLAEGSGIRGIRQRISALRGEFEIKSEKDEGTNIKIEFNLN